VLDIGDGLCPRLVALPLLIGEDCLKEVVVAQVIGRDGAQRADELDGHRNAGCQ
jgi:hypothetical protein